ncbi:phage tail tape measure protein, partial [Escherichia coli]|nr:phage tail tape measure protein [Escherichia coli]
AFQDFTADADNAAGTAEQMFTAAFNSAGNALATFCTTGKLNFKSFTASLLSDLAKIMAQMAMMRAISGIGSAIFGAGGGSTPSGAYVKAAAGVIPNAAGGVYQSADLSRYSGSVVNRPTFFAFAKGAGVMGEAGPE